MCFYIYSVIAIDFGVSFGQGVCLRVPEMVPFRFSPQMANLYCDLDSTNEFFKQQMTVALEAVQERDRKDLILTAMDVFIKEPLDWIQAAEKAFNKGAKDERAGEGEGDEVSWYPRLKVAIAKQKLDRVSPVLILAQELEASITLTSTNRKKCIAYVKKACPAIAHRQHCESAREQVDCLLHLATDANLAGRIFIGWKPFV
jgi:phosphatidylinositol kinase/protein kinase (PI-3  family)